jgi:membrane protease YdiL (CAAX protease family)
VKVFFALFLGAQVLHALLTNRRGDGEVKRLSWAVMVLQTPLTLAAYWIAWQRGVFSRDLVDPVYLGVGLGLGHVVFCFSLLATHRIWRDVWEHLFGLKDLCHFLKENPDMMLRFLGISCIEEVVYRSVAQPVAIEWIGYALPAIVIVAVAFALVHKHFFRNEFAQSAEFMVFALLLGGLYYWTNSLLLVILVHVVRNLESVYLEYLVKVDELGGEQQAMEAIERIYGWRLPERV